jgi:hypothetical protein
VGLLFLSSLSSSLLTYMIMSSYHKPMTKCKGILDRQYELDME